MRNPDRLDDFYDELRELHKGYCPDIRFGQFVFNFTWWLQVNKDVDLFFVEDDKMMQYIREYVKIF